MIEVVTLDQIMAAFDAACEQPKGRALLARRANVDNATVTYVAQRRYKPTAKLLAALGFAQVYVRTSAPPPVEKPEPIVQASRPKGWDGGFALGRNAAP